MLGNLDLTIASTAKSSQELDANAANSQDANGDDLCFQVKTRPIQKKKKKKKSAVKDDKVTGAASQSLPLPSFAVADLNQKEELSWIKMAEKKPTAAEEINRALHEAMRYRPVAVYNSFDALKDDQIMGAAPRPRPLPSFNALNSLDSAGGLESRRDSTRDSTRDYWSCKNKSALKNGSTMASRNFLGTTTASLKNGTTTASHSFSENRAHDSFKAPPSDIPQMLPVPEIALTIPLELHRASSGMASWRSLRTAARSQRARFADMEYDDEFGEPLRKPCRSSCGCMGACEVAKVVDVDLLTGNARDDSCVEPCNQNLRSAATDGHSDAISHIFLATVDVSPELLLKVKNIKAKCEKERKEAEANRVVNSETKTLLAEMMGAVNCGDKAEAWKKLSIAIDSGAAATVIPHTLVTEYPILATPASEAGICYVSATGEPIPTSASSDCRSRPRRAPCAP